MYKFSFSRSFDKYYLTVNDALTSDFRGVVEIKSLTRIGSRKNEKRGTGENKYRQMLSKSLVLKEGREKKN